MMIDDDTLKQLLQIDDELMRLCKWLNERREITVSSRLIPLVDDLTHLLLSRQEQTALSPVTYSGVKLTSKSPISLIDRPK